MPMKTMKMRQLFELVTGDAALHRQVGYMDNLDRCLPRFGLPAIWRLSASGLVRSAFPPSVSISLNNLYSFYDLKKLDKLLSLDIRSPVLHRRRTWLTDYFITAHSTKTSVPNLSVFTGSNE